MSGALTLEAGIEKEINLILNRESPQDDEALDGGSRRRWLAMFRRDGGIGRAIVTSSFPHNWRVGARYPDRGARPPASPTPDQLIARRDLAPHLPI